MAGNFVNSKYKANDGRIFRVRIQPETSLLAFGSQQNAPPVGAVTEKERLPIWKDVKEVGLKTRKIYIKWNAQAPTGYSLSNSLYVVILTPEIWDAIELDQVGTYLGQTFTVVSKIRER